MKYVILIYLLSLCFSIFPEIKPFNFNGYKKGIYTTCFDSTLISNSRIKTKSEIIDSTNFNFIASCSDNLSVDFRRHKERSINCIELHFYPYKELYIKSYNIFSEDMNNINQFIHHSLYFRKGGDITLGGVLTYNFSPLERQGYKLLLFNRSKHNWLYTENLFESRRDYFSPLGTKQKDIWRFKTSMEAKINDSLLIIPKFYYNLEENIKFDSSSVKVAYPIPYNTLLSEIALKRKKQDQITKKHYIGMLGLKTSVFNITNNFTFEANYIYSVFYKYRNSFKYKPLDPLTIELTYKGLYTNLYTYEVGFNLKLNTDDAEYSFKYKNPLSDPDKQWSLEGTIKQKF